MLLANFYLFVFNLTYITLFSSWDVAFIAVFYLWQSHDSSFSLSLFDNQIYILKILNLNINMNFRVIFFMELVGEIISINSCYTRKGIQNFDYISSLELKIKICLWLERNQLYYFYDKNKNEWYITLLCEITVKIISFNVY